MTDVKQIDPLLPHVEVVDHPVITDTKPESVRALQRVVRRRRKLSPQIIDGLGNADPHASRKCLKSFAESLRPNLCGRRHTNSYTPSGLRTEARPDPISPRARAMASITSSRTTKSFSILSSSHARRWIKSARESRSAACSNSCTVLTYLKHKPSPLTNQLLRNSSH